MVDYFAAADSDPGRQREINEDRVICAPERGIFAVIDGVGGHAAGEVAADLAHQRLLATLSSTVADAGSRLREAITLANNTIFREAESRPDLHDMACVVTVALIERGTLSVGHVGDTRLYKIRSGEIHQLTRDHSPIGEREAEGRLSEIEAMRHPRRNEIYRDVGTEPHDTEDADFIDLYQQPFEDDCALVLCSDGLSDLVPSARIRALVEHQAASPAAAVESLIHEANSLGGKDNISAVVVTASRFAATVAARAAVNREGHSSSSVQAGLTMKAGFAMQAQKKQAPWRRFLKNAAVVSLIALGLATLAGVLVSHLYLRKLAERLAEHRDPTVLRVGYPDPGALTSINEALRLAEAGQQIVVGPGEYDESLHLRSGISLIAEPPGGALLRPAASRDSTDELIAVHCEGARDSVLAGFRIAGDDDRPVRIGVNLKGCDIVLEDMEISGAAVAGIAISDGDRSSVRDCLITDNAVGIRIRDVSTPRIVQNLINRQQTFGIELGPLAVPRLIDNRLVRNGTAAIAGSKASAALFDWNDFGKTPESERFKLLEEPADGSPEAGSPGAGSSGAGGSSGTSPSGERR